MKCLFVSSEFPPGPGGIGTHAYQISLQLHNLGWDVTVVSRQDYASREEIEEFNRKQPFSILYLEPASTLAHEFFYRYRTLHQAIRRYKPDVILASGQRTVWLVALITKACRVPWIAVGHGSEFLLGRPHERWLTQWAFEQASRVVCVSNFTQNIMLRQNFKLRKSTVIHNGADEKQFVQLPPSEIRQFRQMLGLEQAHILLSVGNVTHRKGHDIVIRALPKVLHSHPNTHYLIAGLPTQQASLTRLAQALGVQEHVHFLGRISQDVLVKYLNCCDVFVMTSRHTEDGDVEGYGIAVIEAALCGKPAIVSGDTGLAEAVVDGQTGLVVPQEDPEATAQAILTLLGDNHLRQKLGNQARDRAIHEQTWRHKALEYNAILRELASSKVS